MEALCSLKDEWTCIAIEYADVPSAATGRSAERKWRRGNRLSKPAAAAPAVACKKCRRDIPVSAVVDG